MRIDWVRMENFKRFTDQAMGFDRQFTLLVGDNGSGKTTVLDALAVGILASSTPRRRSGS